jgi:regulator of ribonuclease activity A
VMDFQTADLCDEFGSEVWVAQSLFTTYGGRRSFGGRIETLKVFEDNSLVAQSVASDGAGRVLVVDAGGSLRCSMVGDNVAQSACDNGWAGLLIYGAIRDSRAIAGIHVGLQALGTIPRRSIKRGVGQRDLPVHFADVTFTPGHFVYCDEDGVLVAPRELL